MDNNSNLAPFTKKNKNEMDIRPEETIQAVAWLDSMYENSGVTTSRANEASVTIQVNKSR